MLWEEGETKENVEPKQDKGKGRAATVDTEEEDESPVLIPPPSQQSSTGIRSAFRPITKKPRQYFTPPRYESPPPPTETRSTPVSPVHTGLSASSKSSKLPDSPRPEIPLEFIDEMVGQAITGVPGAKLSNLAAMTDRIRERQQARDSVLKQKATRSDKKKKRYTPMFTIPSTSHASMKAQPPIRTPTPAPAPVRATEPNTYPRGTVLENRPWQTYDGAYCTSSNALCFHCQTTGHWQVHCTEYRCGTCNQNRPGHTTSNCPANPNFQCRFCKRYEPRHMPSECAANPNRRTWEYTPDPLNDDVYDGNDWASINGSVESN